MTGHAVVAIRLADDSREALARPPFGARTNGLTAMCWAPLLVVGERPADLLLAAFRAAAVPACAAKSRPVTRPSPLARVWVDATRYATAEDVARHVLGGLPRVPLAGRGDERE